MQEYQRRIRCLSSVGCRLGTHASALNLDFNGNYLMQLLHQYILVFIPESAKENAALCLLHRLDYKYKSKLPDFWVTKHALDITYLFFINDELLLYLLVMLPITNTYILKPTFTPTIHSNNMHTFEQYCFKYHPQNQ